jgi:nucleoside-diphosphate-sugar epimerase
MPHLAGRAEFDWLCGHPATFSFPDTRHDFLLHLATATSAHLAQTDPIEMLKAKLFSISRVLDFARHAGIRRMLVTSSGAVYGRQPPELSHIPETYGGAPDPLNAASAYGTGKRLVEQVCTLTPEVDTVIARCFSFIGPHLPLDARFAAGNFLRDALGGGPIRIRGDGRAIRSYLHAADLTIWLLALLLQGRPRTAYNVGSDRALSILELARRTAVATGNQVEVMVARGGASSTAAPDHYVPDIDSARSEFGLDVRLDLDTALRRTLAWLGAG